jgi:thiol-disulfide isomerase/thioredoxin
MEAMSRRPTAIALLAALALATAACSGTDAVSQTVNGSNGYQVGDAALHWVEPADRATVDGVEGTLLDGTEFDLSSWRGRVVVVNFWGAWCGPCKAETQALEEVHRDTEGKGVEFLGIDVRDDLPLARNFVRDNHVTYPSIYDESNLLALRFRGTPPNATPTTLVLDRQGRIAARHSGAILYTQLRSIVRRVVAES